MVSDALRNSSTAPIPAVFASVTSSPSLSRLLLPARRRTLPLLMVKPLFSVLRSLLKISNPLPFLVSAKFPETNPLSCKLAPASTCMAPATARVTVPAKVLVPLEVRSTAAELFMVRASAVV